VDGNEDVEKSRPTFPEIDPEDEAKLVMRIGSEEINEVDNENSENPISNIFRIIPKKRRKA